jgi:thymidylate kinase
VTSSTGSLEGRGFARIHLHADFEHWGLYLTSYDKLVQLCDDFGAYFLPKRELDYWVMTSEWFFRKKPHYQDRLEQVASGLDDEVLLQAADPLFDKYLSLLYRLDRLRRSGRNPTDRLQLLTLFRELGPRFGLLRSVMSKAWQRRPLRGLVRRRGKLVFLMGVDGAGKTSSAESLVQDHRIGGLDCRCQYLGLKNTIVQQLKDNGSGAVGDSPQSQVPAGLVDRLEQRSRLLGGLANLALSVLYAADYAFRIQRIRRLLGHPDRVVLVDRNYYDRLSGPRRLGDSLLYYMLPRPDLVIALTGAVEELSRRKPEYTPEALREMQTGLSTALAWLRTKNVPVAVIDTVKNDETAVRERMNSLILEGHANVASGQFPTAAKHNGTADLRILSEETVKGEKS